MMDLFKALKDADLWKNTIELKRGAYLSEPGRIDQNIYWVQEGLLHVFIDDKSAEYAIRFGYQGNIISVLDSYISGGPSLYYVQALRRTKVLVATKKDFETFIGQNTEYSAAWTKGLHQLIYEMMERELDLHIADPARRLERVLKRSPKLFQEVPHKYIASYLRMSAETLSRLL
jgi:CRP-like cAMP-binding protein